MKEICGLTMVEMLRSWNNIAKTGEGRDGRYSGSNGMEWSQPSLMIGLANTNKGQLYLIYNGIVNSRYLVEMKGYRLPRCSADTDVIRNDAIAIEMC